MRILEKPLTRQEMRTQFETSHAVEGVVRVELGKAHDGLEAWMDYLSEELTGTELLSDFSYDVVGFEDGNTLLVKVTGDPSLIFENDDEE